VARCCYGRNNGIAKTAKTLKIDNLQQKEDKKNKKFTSTDKQTKLEKKREFLRVLIFHLSILWWRAPGVLAITMVTGRLVRVPTARLFIIRDWVEVLI
jgi:hypothetical protein